MKRFLEEENRGKSIDDLYKEVYDAAYTLCSICPAPGLEARRRKVRRLFESISVMSRRSGRQVLASLVCECGRLFTKQLTETDLNDNQMRFSFSKSHVEQFFLPLLDENEKEDMINGGIPVIVYDEEGRQYKMKFVFWAMRMYALTTTGWKSFYKDNGLTRMDTVTVLMFRHSQTQEICFAIKREEEGTGANY